MAQTENSTVVPKITTVPIEEGAVTVLHLGIGYTSAVRLPEEISSVVLGNPASFKAEHSEAEPRLVFLKPIRTQAVESNALITTKSGQEISLHLISAGQAAGNATVDFLLEYRHPHSVVVSSSGPQTFLIPEVSPIFPPELVKPDCPRGKAGPDRRVNLKGKKQYPAQRGKARNCWSRSENRASTNIRPFSAFPFSTIQNV